MNNKTKKWLIVIGCLVLGAALVAGISQQFRVEKPVDNPESELPVSSQAGDVPVSADAQAEKEDTVVVVPPDTTPPEDTNNGAVSSGTEQTIQGDVSKPEYTEEQLRNPNQKPNEEKATEEDEVESSTASSQPSGGLPGFDNVPNAGPNHGEVVDGDGDINRQVGIMN